jgi:hypothetical protein
LHHIPRWAAGSARSARLPRHSEAEISFSAITLMARRLAGGRITPDPYPSSLVLAAAD